MFLCLVQVLKHLAKEVKVPSYSNSGGSIEVRIRDSDRRKQNDNEFEDRSSSSYISTLLPSKSKHRLLGPTEKLTISRSQPDLSRINKADIDNYNLRTTSPRYLHFSHARISAIYDVYRLLLILIDWLLAN